MTTPTMERINQLTAERAGLFSRASNGARGDRTTFLRIHELDRELATLWEQRRRERSNRPDDIDRLIDLHYARTYGRGYEDSVAPAAVAEAGGELVAA